MKISDNYINEIFEFEGLWSLPSKCGLKIISKKSKSIIIVTELYQDNPGTSITNISTSLAMQIINKFNIDINNFVYIERNPKMNSKLSFYDEDNYFVLFEKDNGILLNPKWKKLSMNDFNSFVL